MFKNMKPLPKALVIGLPIALAVWAYVQFAPKKVPGPVAAPVEITAVPAQDLTDRVVGTLTQSLPPAPEVVDVPKQGTVSSGDAGLNALLKNAGKK